MTDEMNSNLEAVACAIIEHSGEIDWFTGLELAKVALNALPTDLAEENARLRIALHDAICRPMGVVPASADAFYDPIEGERAMNRGPTLRTKPILTPVSEPGW